MANVLIRQSIGRLCRGASVMRPATAHHTGRAGHRLAPTSYRINLTKSIRWLFLEGCVNCSWLSLIQPGDLSSDLFLYRLTVDGLDAAHVLIEDSLARRIAQLQRVQNLFEDIDFGFGKISVGSGNAGGIMERLHPQVAGVKLRNHNVV